MEQLFTCPENRTEPTADRLWVRQERPRTGCREYKSHNTDRRPAWIETGPTASQFWLLSCVRGSGSSHVKKSWINRRWKVGNFPPYEELAPCFSDFVAEHSIENGPYFQFPAQDWDRAPNAFTHALTISALCIGQVKNKPFVQPWIMAMDGDREWVMTGLLRSIVVN